MVYLIFGFEQFIPKRNSNYQPQAGPDPREKTLNFCPHL